MFNLVLYADADNELDIPPHLPVIKQNKFSQSPYLYFIACVAGDVISHSGSSALIIIHRSRRPGNIGIRSHGDHILSVLA